MRLLIEQNVTNATDTNRNIPLLNIGTIEAAGQTTQRQLRGECIYDTIKEMMDLAKMGFRVRRYGYALYMDLYHGKDKEVIFSREFDNLSQMEYVADNTDFRNTVLVVGEGEGTAQKTNSHLAPAQHLTGAKCIWIKVLQVQTKEPSRTKSIRKHFRAREQQHLQKRKPRKR